MHLQDLSKNGVSRTGLRECLSNVREVIGATNWDREPTRQTAQVGGLVVHDKQ